MFILVSLFSLLVGCEEYFVKEKFKRPDWLPGKLYTTVETQENLTLFAECLRRTGLDTILDVSGCWTVFAPTDEAMKQYLSENHYASISSIPFDELERITEFHIIQNPWTFEQLQSLSAYGWRKEDDARLNSYAYKRQTICKNPNEKYWIKRSHKKEMIVIDSTASDGYKSVFVESRKYVPVFYDKYLSVAGLTSEDYCFYFDRVYEQGNVYYAGAKILQADIIAENGFIHIIDRVVGFMLNAKEFLEREIPGETYQLFLEMVYWYYPDFEPNITATFNQPSVRRGGLVDTLWELNYSDLEFALHKELIGYKGTNVNETLVRHNGMFAPTDQAFRKFIDGVLTAKSGFPHWSDYQSLPSDIVEFIVPRHFQSSPIYPSTNFYQEVFGEEGRFRQNEEDIIRKEFGSNCTFIGLDSYLPDRVFTSVTGPVFCRPAYSIFRRAMLYSGTHDIIANYTGELYFFPIANSSLMVDSSLILNWIDRDQNRYNFQQLDRNSHEIMGLGSGAVRNMILNQVGIPVPGGDADKELIRTLAGNYITWDYSDNTIQGTLPCIVWHSGEIVPCRPSPMDEPADNGKAWGVRYWFNFGY